MTLQFTVKWLSILAAGILILVSFYYLLQEQNQAVAEKNNDVTVELNTDKILHHHQPTLNEIMSETINKLNEELSHVSVK